MAVDLEADDALLEALRRSVGHVLAAHPGARLACLNVLRTSLVGVGTDRDAAGRNAHLQRLIELRHWAAPLALPEARVTHHVLEATSPAAAILDHARANGVDHILLGARARGLPRRVLGSVSAGVAREAGCSVTVVRPRSDVCGAASQAAEKPAGSAGRRAPARDPADDLPR